MGTGNIAFTVGDAETAASSLTVAATSSNQTLAPNASLLLGGSGASRTLAITPAANQFGSATITITVSDGSLTASDSFVLTVNPVNDPPTITSIANQSINEDASTSSLAFTVGDVETAAASLTVTCSSSNTTLLPTSGIVLGGSGASRSVTVTPAANMYGSVTVTVTVSDGSATTSRSFSVSVASVNDLPTVSNIPNKVLAMNSSSGAIAFTIGDVETATASLAVASSCNNTALIPASGLLLGGSGASRTITLIPAANKSGTATITVTVTDSNGGSASDTFLANVTADTDGDTIPDAVESAIGSNPGVANTVGSSPSLTIESPTLD